ncbi:hypothetical protein COEREDRAFT_11585 [Coemansia reversa NRRL 1564]|uniref:Uncharacterized protein n=1 Tax=Coemansia reversa (strain ATCC 12441 / NRRL 1564) TaxID=763665 RepID=A0A2G5B2P5_COERN|nr:hypothetical protein COEREDRAFT_11585 [Coemansia reversa NRRL 1564]|eukprot:PIA13292.1 hypothetical protein COEREDRAFT_11585 [Coemansia reversa NRRL 1564]
MEKNQFEQLIASVSSLPGQQMSLKFTDFKGIVSPLIPLEQKNNAKFAPDAVNWLVSANRLLTTSKCPAEWKVTIAADSLPIEKANQYFADCEEKSLDANEWSNFEKFVAEQYSNAKNQFEQLIASVSSLPGQQMSLKFTDFKGIVSPLIPLEQKNNAKFAPDAVNWLVSANRLLTTSKCPAEWKVTIAADSLPIEKANQYFADCEEKSLDANEWSNFEKFVAEQYSNAVNYVDAFFCLMNLTAPSSVATLDAFSSQLEQAAKASKLNEQAVMLLFLYRMPSGIISRIMMEAKNDEPIRLSAVKTLAANHFGSLAMAANAPMEVDAMTAKAPPIESDGIRGGYRGTASFPSYNAVREYATREEYEDRRKRNVCLACGDARHNLRKCPQRSPKGQQN